MGSQVSRSNATAFWISWAPDPSLLVGSHSLPKEYMSTPRGQYKRLACEFSNYPKVEIMFSLVSGPNPLLSPSQNTAAMQIMIMMEIIAPLLLQ